MKFAERLEDIRTFLERATCISPDKDAAADRVKHKVKPPRGQEHKVRVDIHQEHDDDDIPHIDRFRNVFVKPLNDVVTNFVAPVHSKTASQKTKLHVALKDNFVYLHLDKNTRDVLVHAMELISVPKGHVIIKQGDIGDFFYIVEHGTVQFTVDGKDVGTGSDGNAFGELALLHDTPRAATVTAVTSCTLWRVSQDVVRQLRRKMALEHQQTARECVDKVYFWKDLAEQDKERIASALEMKHFAANDVLIHKGTKCDGLVIIQQGTIKTVNVSIRDAKVQDLTFGCNEVFGQNLIQDEKLWPGDARALTDGVMFYLSRDNFIKVVGGLDLDKLIAKSLYKRMLQVTDLFRNSNVDDVEMDSIVDRIKTVHYENNHVFFRQGKVVTHPTIYIVISGTVSVSTNSLLGGTTKILEPNAMFGHKELVPETKGEPVKATRTIAAAQDVTMGVLTLEDIERVILDQARLGRKIEEAPTKPGYSIQLDSLEMLKLLGAGTFGQVWLVCESDNPNIGRNKKLLVKKATPSSNSNQLSGKATYALKVQYKRDILKYNQVTGVLQEKAIMQKMNHPFVMRLLNSYKDEECLYMLVNLFQGGELSSIIHTHEFDGIPEDEVVFFAAGVFEGLSYMHRQGIIHRDLKGENVMLDSDGYCVLIDLGFATEVEGKTYTFCGTPVYMAPEVILGEGHNHGADLWSLGVLIYDMIVGYTPFYLPGMSHVDLYQQIVMAKYKFPTNLDISQEAKDLIRNLLTPKPSLRIGCLSRGELDIRDHAWFLDMDFGKLFRKELQAPWTPNVNGPFDVSKFDASWSKLEKHTKKRSSLSNSEQRYFNDF